MKLTHHFLAVALAFSISFTGVVRSESLLEQAYCRLPADQPRSFPIGETGRHYAPSRQIDVLHLALDVTPDFRERSIAGTSTLRFKPITFPLAELRLDGVDLAVTAVNSSATIQAWQATDEEVIINFNPPIPADQEASVTVTYSAHPKAGMYFRTPEMGYPAGDMHLWTQGEPIEARQWFPSCDFPNEKFTTEITCHAPADMEVLSNGKKVSETQDAGSGLKAVRWVQDKPMANYLISLIVGYLKKVEDTYKEIPMAFWTVPSDSAYASNSFKDTKAMMAFFEEEIGVPYPWDKYDQVCVLDFHWGGMENVSITTLNNSTLHTSATENLRDSQGLVAHELAHQWFGDLVTCKDWSHLWLNEGFATYYEVLFDGHKDGRDTLLYRMYQSAQGILGQANDVNAIVRRNFNKPEEQFGYLAYPKGSWILHMLRSRVGDDLYRRCIRTYLERHKFTSVETKDLMNVFEELTGQSFDQFFDEFVFHAHHPELNISYSWDAKTHLAKLSVKQEQKLSDNVLLFATPLPVRFKTKSATVDRHILIKNKAEDFYFHLEEAPEIVRIDPELTLLAKITFNPPGAMLNAQLADQSDALGRLIAVEKIGQKKDRSALKKLKEILNNDPFYGVRIEASQALRALDSDESYDALVASVEQTDARVRRQVLQDIARTYRDATFTNLLARLPTEKNPDLQALALRSLGTYVKPEVKEQILQFLKTPSFGNTLAEAAVGAMRSQDDTAYIAPLLDHLRAHEGDFDSRAFGRALEILAFLARDADDKSAVRDYLMTQLQSKKERVQVAAIGALGTLGDTHALAALETFSSGPKETPTQRAAENAVKKLREDQPVSVDLGRLRGEVMDLQKENRGLRQDVDDLKKRLESLGPVSDSDSSKKSAAPKEEAPAKKKTKKTIF